MNKKNLIFLFLILVYIFPSNINAFDRISAQKYLMKYWDNRDNVPTFSDYENDGGDCTNFASQCLIAGNILLDKNKYLAVNPGATWDRGCITGVDGLYKYLKEYNLKNNELVTTSNYWSEIKTGDIIQLGNSGNYFHTLIVDYPIPSDDTMIACHSDDDHIELSNKWPGYDRRFIGIPDSPIIKYICLTQNVGVTDKIVYEWKYDGDYSASNVTGEYYSHTYNGLNPVKIKDAYANNRDELKLKIIFDQTINTSNILVSFGKSSPYNTVSFNSIGWTSTLYSNDTWEGKATIPSGASISDRNYISIDAYSIGGGPLVVGTRIDKDGTLDQYNPGPNIQHGFLVPYLSFFGSAPKGIVNSSKPEIKTNIKTSGGIEIDKDSIRVELKKEGTTDVVPLSAPDATVTPNKKYGYVKTQPTTELEDGVYIASITATAKSTDDTLISGTTIWSFTIPPFDKPAWVRVAVIEHTTYCDWVGVFVECADVPNADKCEIEVEVPEINRTYSVEASTRCTTLFERSSGGYWYNPYWIPLAQTSPIVYYQFLDWAPNSWYYGIENPDPSSNGGRLSSSSRFRARARKGDLVSDWTDWVYYSQKQYFRLNP